MRVKWMFLLIFIVFIAGVYFSVLVLVTKENTDVDIVAVNEVLHTVEGHWGHIEQGDYRLLNQQFTVLDNSGSMLYQTAGAPSTTINDAIKNRDTILDVMVNGTPDGKLIIFNDYKEMIQQIKIQLVIVIFVTFTTLTVMFTLYILFINHTVFKPFQKLQDFALNVARGNLDIPLEMDKNNPFGAFTESFDIMREELAAARNSEYAANRSKKELVAGLSHDIKTPVASIKAVAELMLLRATDEKMIKQLNTVYSKAEQIHLLVTDMFHATLEELKELKVTVSEAYSSVLKGMIANVNYDDQVTCEPIPDCILLMDAMRLQQVFDNIISNAYKYAGTSVKITSLVSHSHLELYIHDYGNGITSDELPLLFNKFYRGNNAEGQSGSGLGLYISKYFMQNMQGDIECYNREDGFTVTLKIKLA
ncbi:HAMP domain-containing sensor histidine kinase [Paenibacillus sp.]|jgi:signal transduction histidine kinase|uniref:HAMP domain-containing sensor histidine kinase n=1 Tax=Paenibacillus sp. TaxID=58172 RepID=UPI002835F306|nr:HAMP domain-containing sensor histidine kinase [Paenibacillus sp.]MDR0269329.1 HAMP domain-containing histidine kinase [Paenibacillus sp.]